MSQTKTEEIKPNETKPRKMVRRCVAIALGIICILLIVLIAYFTVTGISAQNSYNNLQNQNKQLQTRLDEKETLLNETQTWLAGNITSYEAQISSLNAVINQLNVTTGDQNNTIASLYAQITKLQTWLSGNITAYQNELNQYNAYVADHHHTDEDYANIYNITSLSDSTVWVNDQTISQSAGAYTSWTESANYTGYVSIFVQTSSVAGTHVKVIYSAYGVDFNQEIVVSAGSAAVFPIMPSSSIQIEVGNGNLGIQGGATETVTITYYY